MSVVKLNSLFRVQTLLVLNSEISKSGYDIAKEIELVTGKKPSSGKIYPFLKELASAGYIIQDEAFDSENQHDKRLKKGYFLTHSGQDLVKDLMDRMGNIIDARLEELLDACYHCGIQLFDSKVYGQVGKSDQVFCCTHCMAAYTESVTH